MSSELIFSLLSLIYLIICSIIDLRMKKVSIVLCVLWGGIGLICNLFYSTTTLLTLFVGVLPGLFLILSSRITKGAIGMGDGIVVIVLGIFNGGIKNLTILMYALFVAAVFSIGLLLMKKINKKESIPFIPFLLMGYLVTMLLEGNK